jgi:hypothetical protein
MKTHHRYLTVLTIFLSLFLGAQVFQHSMQYAGATAKEEVCNGLGLVTGADGNCVDPNGTSSIDDNVKLVINILSVLVGISAIIMIILGGLKFITSNGDANKIGSAKNTILYAVIGLVIVALAQVIVRFTIGKALDTATTCNPTATVSCAK